MGTNTPRCEVLRIRDRSIRRLVVVKESDHVPSDVAYTIGIACAELFGWVIPEGFLCQMIATYVPQALQRAIICGLPEIPNAQASH
eukprot:448318-Amphidinium_carterae.1